MARPSQIVRCLLLLAVVGCGQPTSPPEHREPVEDLVRKLRDPQQSLAVHAEAIQVLGMKGAGSPEAVAAVADALLAEKGSLARQSAVIALRKMHATSALPKLREAAAQDADPGVRQAAAALVAELEKSP
ncbi:MAG TPA: HEAT repeat domain-containing protein [Gemmataceae bacterium]|jgi:HEAT repeat protein|nr:HEAT repeat domain-containing protein [Gemmataceae bacterium]